MLPVIFCVITLVFLVLFYWSVNWNRRVIYIAVPWILFIAMLSFNGFFTYTDTVPPRFLIVFIGNLLFVMLMLKYIKQNQFKDTIGLSIHALRVVVELILYELYITKQIPKIMTFEGYNFDILIGVSAIGLLVWSYLFKSGLTKYLLLMWNVVGLLFLVNIVVIAILSAPLPMQQFAFDQPNKAVLYFPYILLPAFIVPVVFVTHIVSLKKLLNK
ncbi:MAG: hypothetical protein MUC81_12480 [Bacteroidia bacterium]|jgi:hypothetical protein|nr:hypothetical protein [Bacteroidia bacterium]